MSDLAWSVDGCDSMIHFTPHETGWSTHTCEMQSVQCCSHLHGIWHTNTYNWLVMWIPQKITANSTIPTPYLFSKLYGRLCAHHNSFNSISVAKPTHTHPWYEPQTNLPENDSIKLTNNNHTHVYHMLFHVLMCTNWSHVGWSSHFLIHIQHLWSKFNTCDTTSIFMIYDVM